MTEAPTFGVDVGGTNVKIVAIDCEGKIWAKTQFSTLDLTPIDLGAAIRVRLDTLATELCHSEHIAKGNPISSGQSREVGERGRDAHATCVGLAAPGLIAADYRSVSWMQGRMEAICGVDWTHALRASEKVPVLNDAKAALLGEAWIGAAQGARNAILLTLGTGVGGAAIVDGRLLHGAIGRAGHLGHISLKPDGLADIVRTPGSLEDQVGNATLAARSGGRFTDTQALVEAVRQGDAFAVETWRRSIRALAAGVVSLINVLDPEIVILGGGIARVGNLLLDPLNAALAEMEWRPFGSGVPIVAAALDEYAGAVGAARFAMTFDSDQAPI